MREIRLSGLEGGGAVKLLSLPLSVVAVSPRCAVSQSFALPVVGKLRRVGPILRFAEFNSAIQRSAAKPQPKWLPSSRPSGVGCDLAALRCMYLAASCAQAGSTVGNAVSAW